MYLNSVIYCGMICTFRLQKLSSQDCFSALASNMPFRISSRVDDANKHENDVSALVYTKGKLYSGADDGKIKVCILLPTMKSMET